MNKKQAVLCLTIAALAFAGAVLFAAHLKKQPDAGALEIRESDTGKILGKWRLNESGEFAIEFIHSVNKSPVRETFQVKDGRLWPISARLYSFGAGYQGDLDEGQVLSADGEAMIISGFSSSYKELNLIIGTVSDHVLFINNEIISLRELAGRNAHITIQYR